MRSAYVVCLAVLLQISICMPTDNSTVPSDIVTLSTLLDELDAEPSNNGTESVNELSSAETSTADSTTSDSETENVPYQPEEEGQNNGTTTTAGTTAEPPSSQAPISTTPSRGVALLCPELLLLAVPFFVRLSSTRLLLGAV